jgi:hypothetical protein
MSQARRDDEDEGSRHDIITPLTETTTEEKKRKEAYNGNSVNLE